MVRTTLLVIFIMITTFLLMGAAPIPFTGFGGPEKDPDLTGVIVDEGFAKVSTLHQGVYLYASPLVVSSQSDSFSLAKVSDKTVKQIYFKPCKSCSNWYVLSLTTVAVPKPGKVQWRYTYNP